MAIQYSLTHRTALGTELITEVGSSGFLLIYSGSEPGSCAATETGTLLVSLPLNAVPAVESAGVLTFNGTTTAAAASSSNPIVPAAAVAGTATHWRLATSSAGTTVVAQGTVGASGADLNFAAGTTFTAGELISVSSFTITAAGA